MMKQFCPTCGAVREVSEETLLQLGLMAGPLLMLGGLAATIFLMRYELSRTRHAKVQSLLLEARQEAEAKAGSR